MTTFSIYAKILIMNNNLFHGSPFDITDEYLRPGWSTHLQQNCVYSTESKLMAIHYALFAKPDSDEFKSLSYFDKFKRNWETIFIIKSPESLKGYIYEIAKPDINPIEYVNETTGDFSTEYTPGAKAIFAIPGQTKILAKQFVDYNYVKNTITNPFRVFVLKKSYNFQQGIEKIQKKFKEISDTPFQNQTELNVMLGKVLDEYTEK